MERRKFEQRFWAKVQKAADNECWLWLGRKMEDGRYGRLGCSLAHRRSFEISVGPIPPGLCVMHSCDNGLCVNPHHLSIGTHRDNMLDKCRKGRDNRASLSPETVIAIRRARASGEKIKAIAARFGCSVFTAYTAATGQSFAWLSDSDLPGKSV
ncbi:HNH endonuclease [Mesorhizobium sp.]|uniref:HNH endonuclease n=1 Tax=Mesorhizobium sp. TaxID=1871066 RepID=UPI000FE58DF9|nr:HNH endonuclease [Mesorhizobium sp.]RWE44210.1 MAG: HNH endonuclease [Mesorhizobium sp.]